MTQTSTSLVQKTTNGYDIEPVPSNLSSQSKSLFPKTILIAFSSTIQDLIKFFLRTVTPDYQQYKYTKPHTLV
jgi:hypothetical protein